MRATWLGVLVLVAGCFADPPGVESSGSTSDASSSGSVTSGPQTTSSVSTSGPSSSGEGTTSVTSSTSSSTAADTSTGETGPACGDRMVCTANPPPKWQGPVAVVQSEGMAEPPLCPPGTEEQWRGGADPRAVCDCSTCAANGPLCTAEVEWGENGSCDVDTVSGVGCQPFPGGADNAQLVLSVLLTSQGQGECLVPESPEPRFERRAVACDLGELDACDDGVCVRPGPRCIWREGVHMCGDDYPEQVVLFDAINAPKLECDGCNCGASELSCASADITAYAAPACGGEQQGDTLSQEEGECLSIEGGFFVVDDVASLDIQPFFACEAPQETAPASGRITPVGARTFCCDVVP